MICPRGVPHLVVMAPGSDRARRIDLHRDYMVVGREAACDVRFDDPHVSRAHAALQRFGSAVYIRDLGSSGGTFIGGSAVTSARKLHAGDVVAFATVTARFEPAGNAAEATVAAPARAAAASSRDRNGGKESAAGWLSWPGLLVLIEGIIVIAATELRLRQPGRIVQDGRTELLLRPLEPRIAGIPSGLLGWALTAVGALLLAAGIGLIMTAASRRAARP
jgi:FHA domain